LSCPDNFLIVANSLLGADILIDNQATLYVYMSKYFTINSQTVLVKFTRAVKACWAHNLLRLAAMSTEVLGNTNRILVCELNTGNLYICPYICLTLHITYMH